MFSPQESLASEDRQIHFVSKARPENVLTAVVCALRGTTENQNPLSLLQWEQCSPHPQQPAYLSHP